MSKRDPSDLPDPFDDLLFDDPLEQPLDEIANIKLDEIEDEVDPERAQWKSNRATVSGGQIIIGFVQVILMAALALALFLAIAFVIMFGAQRLGLIPQRGAESATSAAALPTQAASIATSAPEAAAVPTDIPAPLASATPDTTCPTAPAWWNSQQIQDNYVYFTQRALEEARTTDRISALLEQMRIRRNFVENFGAAPCLAEAQSALLRGFDSTIEAARALNAGNTLALKEQQATASSAYAALTVELWAFGANADPLAPPILGVGRNSGAECGAQTWYSAVKPHVDAFYAAADQIDVVTSPPDVTRPLLDTMQTERDAVAAAETPQCAQQAQTHLLAALDSYRSSIEQRLAGSLDTAMSEHTRQNTIFNAWVLWLGVN
jgi:hypothetical protein